MSNSKQAVEPLPRHSAACAKGVSGADADTVANIMNINVKLPVELLTRLLLFVNASRCRNFKPNNSVALDNVGAVTISRQFDLRYVCLLWHNIVHRAAQVGVSYSNGDLQLFNRDPFEQLSGKRHDTGPLQHHVDKSASTEKKRNGQWYFLFDCIQSIHVCVYNNERRNKSILFALRNATKGIQRPCDLSLDLTERFEAIGSLLRDPCADFENEYPTLTLRSLSLTFGSFITPALNEDQYADVKDCAKYCLSIGKQTLSRAKVQLAALDDFPEDWVCETLKDLSLELTPPGYSSDSHWSAERMLQEFDKQARIPRLFPRLERIELGSADWPHVDLACLNQLSRLKTLALFAVWLSEGEDLRRDWRLVALPRVETLQLSYRGGPFPAILNEIVPSLKRMEIVAKYSGAGMDLLSQFCAAGNGFAHLEHLSVELDFPEGISPPADVIALFAGLRQLASLTSLAFSLSRDESVDWCRPGDLSLLHVLPPQLESVSLAYCLIPAAVAPDTHEVNFIYDPNVPDAEESIYKVWLKRVEWPSTLARKNKHLRVYQNTLRL